MAAEAEIMCSIPSELLLYIEALKAQTRDGGESDYGELSQPSGMNNYQLQQELCSKHLSP